MSLVPPLLAQMPVGRFAPSPTGPLHFGSLVAAIGSYCDVKAAQGRWLLRIEDIDPPRNPTGISRAILHSLEAHGLHWDGPIVWQSQRAEAYESALQQLHAKDLVYACQCSRTALQRAGNLDCLGPCRHAHYNEGAWRFRLSDNRADNLIHFHDRKLGDLQEDVTQTCGDFVLKRRDGLYAYQLAVVVDDAATGVTDVVRGRDLLDNTARQCLLQAELNVPRPRYLHLPLALSDTAQKLSKQNHAPALQPERAPQNICAALRFLGQTLPTDSQYASINELLGWAIQHWQPEQIPAAP